MATKDVGTLRTRLSWEGDDANRSLEGFRRDLKGLRSEMNLARSGGRDYTNSLKGMRSQSDILTRTLKTQQERVKELRHRYDESVKAKGEDANQTKELASQLNNATAQMNRTENQLKNLNAEIKRQENPWTRLGNVMDKTGDKMQKIGKSMTDFGKSYSMRVTAPIVAGGVAVFKASMDYESAFAGIRKTVDMTEEGYAELSAGIREMTKVLPASAVEIAAVGEAAGQLGIQNEHILSFTRTMIDLGEATNMTAETAATEFARFANIVGMSQKDFDRLGSVVVDLGNNLATTEAEITSMALRLAGAGAQVGLTEAQIMAFAGALSSVGIEADAGGSAFSKVMVNMALAAERGGDELKAFADVAGMSANDFKKAFEDDAAGAILKFIEGLSTAEERGLSAIGILDEMGITEVRMRDALLRASGATDVFTESIQIGSNAWKENTALTEEAAQRYGTTESKLKMMWNRIKDVSITLGDALVPAVMSAIDAAEPLIKQIESGAKAFSEMDEEQQRTILKMIALVAAVGPASVVLGGLSSTIGGILKVGGGMATMLGAGKGTGLIARIGMLGLGGPVGLAVAGVGALAGVVYLATREKEKLQEVSTEYAESLVEEAQDLRDYVAEFDDLRGKTTLTTQELGRLRDIQDELNRSQDPSKLEALQKEYDGLTEKSGLSKEEIIKLLEVNDKIIQQAPEVETAHSTHGNAIVENTKKVTEYIQSLEKMALADLKIELGIQMENEVVLLRQKEEAEKEILEINKELNKYLEIANLGYDGQMSRLDEIHILLGDMNLTKEEEIELLMEEDIIQDIINGRHRDKLDSLKDEKVEQQDIIDAMGEELAKSDEIRAMMADILLTDIDINYEKGEGLTKLDQKIDKLKDERDAITDNLTEEQYLSGEYRYQLGQLDDAISKHESIRDEIENELGFQSTYRSTQEKINENTAKQKQLIGSNYIEQEKQNKLVEEMNEEYGKPIDKTVDVKTNPTTTDLDKKLSSPIRRMMNIVEQRTGLKAPAFPAYAAGTNYHPGGPALVGEEGYELARLGNRWSMLDFGVRDLPRGTEVFTHSETKRILGALNRIPAYANGVSGSGESNRVVSQLNNNGDNYEMVTVLKEQNTILLQLLKKESVAHVEFDSLYDPFKKRLAEDQYSNHKRRR